MTREKVISMIFKIMNEKIEKMGGAETVIRAVAWKWWSEAPINDDDDFNIEIAKCKQAYQTIMDYIEVEDFFGGDYEDTINFSS